MQKVEGTAQSNPIQTSRPERNRTHFEWWETGKDHTMRERNERQRDPLLLESPATVVLMNYSHTMM